MPKIVQFEHPAADGRVVKVGACHPDRHDPEHTHYDATQWEPDDLPAFVDLRPHLTPVEDQGEVGSCTANALAGALEYLEKRLGGEDGRVSRLFIYWNERDLEGKTAEDHGAAISDGIHALKEDGACSEETWRYDKHLVFKKPHDDAYEEAVAHTIDEAHRVKIELHDMKHCLAEGYPFVFGLQIFDPFEHDGTHGHIRTPNPSADKACGGHAMLCVGYSDADEVFLVRNSWGPDWGDSGYCYVPYDYLANPKFCHDAWTIRRAHDLDFSQGVAGGELPHGNKASFFEENAGHTVSLADDSGEDAPEDSPADDAPAEEVAPDEDAPEEDEPAAKSDEEKTEDELQAEIDALEKEIKDLEKD